MALIVLGSLAFFWIIVIPVFERFASPEVVRAYQRLTMPFFRLSCGFTPGFGVVETIGRRTGVVRRVPVGGRLSGDTFWLVAGLGRRANYVRNIEANPRVRVKVYGRWRSGTAHLCPDDDPRKRMIRISPINGFFLWVAGGDHLTVRIDLDHS
ncbi:MAG: nitroreductase/quinone reductase family protein [Actinomycetota bacterium]